jgi:hypothetical protein
MFANRIRALMVILLIAGLASFYDFLLFFDGYRSWLASNPQLSAPFVLFAVPYVVIGRNLLGLIGSVYAPLALAGLIFRAGLIRSAIAAAASLQIGAAALLVLTFGSLSKMEDALLYVIFAAMVMLWSNGAEAKKAFAPAGAPEVKAQSWPFLFFLSRGFFLIAAFAGYIAAAYYVTSPPPAAEVYERPRELKISGDYRTIYKYSVFVPEGYKMQNAAASASAPPAFPKNLEFTCILTKGDDRIIISDNRGEAMDRLKSFALFFRQPSEREFLRTIANERIGVITLALKRVFGSIFNREALTPHFTGFCSDGPRPSSGGGLRPGRSREFTLWDRDASNSVMAVFIGSTAAFDASVMSAVVSTLKLEDRIKSAADYYADGVKLYGEGLAEEAKYSFASALYYNFSDYASHYYIARCFHETGASDSAVVFHLNNAVKMISSNRFFAAGSGAASLKPLAGPADIKSAMEELSKLIAPAAATAVPAPGFFF